MFGAAAALRVNAGEALVAATAAELSEAGDR
jgi:hypothetical protein